MARRTSHPDTTFAHAFGVDRSTDEGWFDPRLHRDTELFIDPFLMFDADEDRWSDVHQRLVRFFNEAIGLIADSGASTTSLAYRRAQAMLSFPEPPEFCLGYGKATIFGSGSSRALGEAMTARARSAIQVGLRHVEEFGELMIFGEHFGADRISDMTCNIAKEVFVAYTQEIAERHDLPTRPVTLRHSSFDLDRLRWRTERVELPFNPCWDPSPPVLFVPEVLLSDLPKMDDAAFWDWVYRNHSEQLRTELGVMISEHLDREAIIARAKRSIPITRKYGLSYVERYRKDPPDPYDVEEDPRLRVRDFETAQAFSDQFDIPSPVDESEFCDFVRELVEGFRWFVEERGGSKNFWTNETPYTESQAQSLFHASVVHACKAADVDIAPESDAGRGPVDFKFSAGWTQRALVEMKFAKSSSYWANLERQLPTYMSAEGVGCGFIVVIQHQDEHCDSEFVSKTLARIQSVAEDSEISYEVIFVDVRRRPSASKVR